jgi:fermentation-respiration switch protein FrsA (DUF1100 family)
MRKPILIGAGILAGLAALYVVVGGFFVSRELGSILHVGAPTAQGSGWPAPQGPANIGYIGDPRAAYDYAFTGVNLESALGDLPAWLIRPGGTAQASRWAIFVHGIGGRRENGYRFLPVLREAGLPVLMMSYRNDEGAPADPSGSYAFGLTEWQDLDIAVEYALANGAEDLVLVAESMGGGIVGQFLRHSAHADAIAAIVLDAPALDFRGIVAANVGHMGLPLSPVLTDAGLLFSGFTMPFRLGEADVRPELEAFAGPLFLSHGAADSIVPVAGSDSLLSGRVAVTDYLRTRADHIQSWAEDSDRYDAALAAFLSSL